jgi:predicted ATPase
VLTGFSIENFKNLAALPSDGSLIPFGSVNVLIGPNGCGKSSLLQAIDFLKAFFKSSVEVYLKERGWEYSDLPNLRQTSKTIRWTLTAELGPDEDGRGAGKYHYTVSLQPRRHLGIGNEQLDFTPNGHEQPTNLLRRKGRNWMLLDRRTGTHEKFRAIGLPASAMSQFDPASDSQRYPEMLHFRAWVERFRSFLIWDPKVLRNPDRGKHTELGPSGEHLASLVGRLKDDRPEVFRKYVARLKRLFPSLSDINVSGRGWGWREIRLIEGHGDRAASYNSRQISDGVLRLMAITSLLYLDHIPSLITLEEPENGVHPQLVREVIQILREITQRKPPNHCQVIFTTHSPYVLDEFLDHPEEVYCLDRPQPLAGATIQRLSDAKQLKVARDAFEHSLGEAWTTGLIGATAGVRYP